jgi:hypothetical protein
MTRTRPLGITIIATVLGFFALLSLCGSLTSLGFAPFAIFSDAGFGGMFSQGFGALFGLILAVAQLLLVVGLWTLQPWAFWATVIVEVLALFNGGFGVTQGLRGALCGINIIPLLVLAYLFLDKDVRRAFRT